ncbi:MAG: hypothetical protein ABIA93_02960 [Candidatus Woesearchaeota archaeon]
MKKAQAALEFIATYGWIILGVLVVVGALAYFGYLNPERMLPERCEFTDQLVCEEVFMSETDLMFMLHNKFTEAINVTSITGVPGMICNEFQLLPDNISQALCTADFTQYDHSPIHLNVTFIRTNGTIYHNFEATIVTTLQVSFLPP